MLHKRLINELAGRRDYLYKAFHLYFVLIEESVEFITFQSFPLTPDDIIFVTGHEPDIVEYLAVSTKYLADKVVVLTTCFPNRLRKYASKYRAMYFAQTNDKGEAETYVGSDFGVGFDITLSELDLVNSNERDPIKKIEQAYTRIDSPAEGSKKWKHPK